LHERQKKEISHSIFKMLKQLMHETL